MSTKHAIVWSQRGCTYCEAAKQLLKLRGYAVEERKIGDGYSKEEFFEENPGAMSVPQIWVEGVRIHNGYSGLQDYLTHAKV